MKKKLVLLLISAVLSLCCSSCSTFEVVRQAYEMYKTGNTEPFETKTNFEEDFVNYVESQFKEKYGKEFKLLGFHSPFMSISRDCDMKCVDDGIEFQATVHSKDYYEVESENYLCHKYLNQVQEDIHSYMNQYLSDYKYAEINIDSTELPFSTSPDLTYEEFRKSTYFYEVICFCNDRNFSDEEMKLIEDKFGGYGTEKNYKEEIDMRVNFRIYLIPEDAYNRLETCTKIISWQPGWDSLLDENTVYASE
ncbi:MAG: hypothetical protein IKP69_07860 [Oscillospiraceae bacterium]|nr:hypothetical protein [Oscillospiraceae bacterium]